MRSIKIKIIATGQLTDTQVIVQVLPLKSIRRVQYFTDDDLKWSGKVIAILP